MQCPALSATLLQLFPSLHHLWPCGCQEFCSSVGGRWQ